MSKTAWVGIDVSKRTFDVAIADDSATPRQWTSLPGAQFEHSQEGAAQFLQWLSKMGWRKKQIIGICIEATGRYTHQWIELLDGRLEPVCVVNPARPKAYGISIGIRHKSDHVDARILALYAKATDPQPMRTESPAQRELRELSRLHQSIEVQYQANQRRLADGPSSTFVRATLKKIIADLKCQLNHLEQAMDKLIRQDAQLYNDFKRAKTVKGIGTKTATIILAEFGDLRNYGRNQLVALAGLYPREYTSGTSVHKRPRLAKAGKASVRAALYMCAMSAMRADPNIGNFVRRLNKNGKVPMQVIIAVMRKLLMIFRAVVVTETDYDSGYKERLQ